MFLISLAIGTLIGTSFFHLIPQVRFIFSVKLSHFTLYSFEIELNKNTAKVSLLAREREFFVPLRE